MSQWMRRVFGLTPFRVSLVLTILLVLFYLWSPRFFDLLELKTLDLRLTLRGPVEPGPEVVIAAIDEKSIDQVGRWPWPRARVADLVRTLSEGGAEVIAFDIGFFEPDQNSNLALIERLGRQLAEPGPDAENLRALLKRERILADNDLLLAEAIAEARCPVVMGYFFHLIQDETVAHLSPATIEAKMEAVEGGTYSFVRLPPDPEVDPSRFLIDAHVAESNVPLLAEASGWSGYFNMFPDPDGVVRWVPMVITCRGGYYMPLSLQTLRQYLGVPPSAVDIGPVGVEAVDLGDLTLPTDETGQLLVNYRGPSKTFPHLPVIDIINGTVPPEAYQDKIVLVGATAVGTFDLRVTPFDSVYPGIEVHANAIDTILRRDFILRPAWTAVFDLAAIIIIGLVLGFFLPRLSAIGGSLAGLGLIGAWSAANYYLFLQGIWVSFVYPLSALVVVYAGITVYRYVTEERERKRIRGAFSYYVNPSVVSEMLKNPDMLKLGGDKRIMSVLFSDIRGFTTISEKLDPEALVHLLNQYLTAMTDLVFEYDGLVDKYIGDALMAVWGAPLPQHNHALLACQSALDMLDELENLRKTWAEEDPELPFIDIGVGINSGPMVVGNMGSESRFDYTVMGDAVNLGSRLEGANKQYGTRIIIGEITFAQVSEDLYCRELDSVAVKGKAQPVIIYELLGRPGHISEDRLKLARLFTRGVTAYKERRWDDALRVFTALSGYYPEDKPTAIYLERVKALRKNPPPPGWDGVFVMTTK